MDTVYVPSSCRETTVASLVNFLSPDRCTSTLKPAVAGGVVEEEEADAARVEDLEDGDGVVELRVHVVAAPVARRVQIARVGLADEHAHVGVQVELEDRGRRGGPPRVV